MGEKVSFVNMKDIRIIRLTLENFKGQRRFELEPNGRNCSIFGDNAAGKTTLYDGLTWLLFGKDSRGQANFEVKPLGSDGQVLDHQAITSVEAVLAVDDEETALRKCYYEKWSTKRGSTAETFDGHSSDYYIDGVPVKKYEFDRQVSELVDEDLFRTLTNVTYFCGGLDWRSRRSILFELGQVAGDREIMEGSPEFAPLADALGKLTLDDYKKRLQAERKGYVGIRNDLPTRLDECQKTIDSIEGTDFGALRRERDARTEKRDALSADLLKLDNDTYLATRRNDRDRLQNERTALEQKNADYRRAQEVQAPDVGKIQREIKSLETSLLRLTDSRRRELAGADECDAEVTQCRDRWIATNSRNFDGADCPVCGRPLEGELLTEAQGRFEREKKAEQDDLVRDSNMLKARASDYRKRADELADEAVGVENKIANLTAQLEAAKEFRAPKVTDMPGYETSRSKLDHEIAELNKLIQSHASDGAAIKAETSAKIKDLTDEISAIDRALAKQEILEFSRNRMDQLRAEAAVAAEKLEALDRMMFLCEDFVRFKTKYIEDGVNGRFSLVKWKLFAEQVNGGLTECCEATVGGVPYGSLNSGMRINAGIDVISAMSAHYGVKVPLVVDNAETVTALRPLDTQIIRLVVSEQDKELRCEYENQG